LISTQAVNLLAYIPMPNIPVTSGRRAELSTITLQNESPRLSNRLNVNVNAPAHLEAEAWR